MSKKTIRSLFSISSLLSAILFGALSLKSLAQEPDANFAWVNGQSIRQALYDFLLGVRERDYPDESMSTRQSADNLSVQKEFETKVGRDLLVAEILAQEATRLGIANSEKFKLEMEMAQKTLLAQMLVQHLMRSVKVPEAELHRIYAQMPADSLYRIAIAGFATKEDALAIHAQLQTRERRNIEELTHMGFKESSWMQLHDIAPELRGGLQAAKEQIYISEPLLRGGKWQLVTLLERKTFEKPSFDEQRETIEAEWIQRYVDEEIDRLAQAAQIKLGQTNNLDIDHAWLD